MGKLWDKFKDKMAGRETETPALVEEVKPAPKAVEQPMRAWRHELLSSAQMEDLDAIISTPGYEVLQDLWSATLEGFITYMVELPPEQSEKILAYHKIVHGLHLGIKSVNSQVNGYSRFMESEREERDALKKALELKRGEDPLENADTLNKLLDPIYQPQVGTSPRVLRATKSTPETPIDLMLKSREQAK